MYNLLTLHTKKISVLLVLLEIGLIFTLYYYAQIIFKTDAVYYYIFSSITQTFVALVAFLGAVVIYRLEIYENELLDLGRVINPIVFKYHTTFDLNVPIREIMDFALRLINRQTDYTIAPGDHQQLFFTHEKMRQTLGQINLLRNSMIDLAIFAMIDVALSLTGLLFVPILVKHPYVGMVILFGLVFLSLYVLYKSWFTVRYSLGYAFTR